MPVRWSCKFISSNIGTTYRYTLLLAIIMYVLFYSKQILKLSVNDLVINVFVNVSIIDGVVTSNEIK